VKFQSSNDCLKLNPSVAERSRALGFFLFKEEKMMNQIKRLIRRGDIYYANLEPVVGSEQGGLRPVLIIQNNVGNWYSPTVIAAAITSRSKNNRQPTHIQLDAMSCGLSRDSTVLLEQIRTLDRYRLSKYVGHICSDKMMEIDAALRISVGLGIT